MFERYAEASKRVVFFSRYEAAASGSATIGTEHLLLGLIREARGPAFHILTKRRISMETIRGEPDRRLPAHEKVELPLSEESKRALESAVRESEALGHDAIGPEHILLGILTDTETRGGSLLHGLGLRLDEVRAEVVELCKDPEVRARLPLETLLRDYDREPSRREHLEESDLDEIEELREKLRVMSVAMDAAIGRGDFEGFEKRHAQHLAAEIRLRQLLE